ncbi:hypothetical protein PMAYCL1PPCAC_21883, partial [Pristionchus mayeri]
LNDRPSEISECLLNSRLRIVGGGDDVTVGDVSRVINGETNAHDDCDHRDRVLIDTPQGHETENSQVDRPDCEGDPEGARGLGNEKEGDEKHASDSYNHILHCVRHYKLVLVSEEPEGH